MTQENFNRLPADLTNQIFQLFEKTAKSIKLIVTPQVLKAEFADGQRVLINFNPKTGHIWLAGHHTAMDFSQNGEHWVSVQDGSELLETLARIVHAISASSVLNAMPGKLQLIDATKSTTLAATIAKKNNYKPIWQYLLILLPILFIGVQFVKTTPSLIKASTETANVASPVKLETEASLPCESNRPENGATHVFVESKSPISERAEIKISNEHDYDILVFFTKPNTAMPLSSVLVKSKNTVSFPVALSQYELMFSTGNTWCNLQIGFKGGQFIKLDNRLEITKKDPLIISLQSTGSTPADFQVFLREQQMKVPSPPAMNIVSEGVVELQQSADGHYYIPGTINGEPLVFMVDTGASITTLKREVALAGGIRDCRMAKMNTANGVVEACIGLIPDLRIGPYIINNAEVAANPNTEINLLGMNVLSQFQIKTEKGIMRLSKQ